MIEKQYALELKEKLQKYFNENKTMCFFEYEELNEKLKQCDYKTLQAECEKLDFHIYNFKDSPIFQDNLSKKHKKLKSYIIYSNETIALTKKFKNITF